VYHSGVIDEDVEPAELLYRRGDGALDGSDVAGIGQDRHGLAAGRLDGAHNFIGFFRGGRIGDGDVGWMTLRRR
jgi:hypothetical protein